MSCIHEYPEKIPSTPPGESEDHPFVNLYLEVGFDQSWGALQHDVEFSARAIEKPHRFIIEILRNGSQVCQEIDYLSHNEFLSGKLYHKVAVTLSPLEYQLVIWYDRLDEDGNLAYDATSLRQVALKNLSSTDADILQCGYTSETLDLTSYAHHTSETTVNKEYTLSHAGARFEIVATDVQQFINEQKDALNQGDKFNVSLSFSHNAMHIFNAYSGEGIHVGDPLEISGRMRLPFADYDKLKIAEGFFFCEDTDEISAVLTVKNSSLRIVSQTDAFSFPVKRGAVTTISGNFLTHPVGGIFSIDNIWDGEIFFDIENDNI